jgi:hypothetical protein
VLLQQKPLLVNRATETAAVGSHSVFSVFTIDIGQWSPSWE